MNAATVIVLVVGAGLEAVGLVLAAVGFRRTWREFSPGGRLFEPELERAALMWRATKRGAQKLLRRRPHGQVVQMTGIAAMGISSSATVRVRWGPMPSATDEPDRLVAELERRINDLHEKIQDSQERQAEEARSREEADADVRADLRAQIERVERMSRSIAIGGLREQVYGWSCIALGVVFQTVAGVMSAGAG